MFSFIARKSFELKWFELRLKGSQINCKLTLGVFKRLILNRNSLFLKPSKALGGEGI